MSGEVLGGGRMADDEGQWRTVDREKFLLRFSTAVKKIGYFSEISDVCLENNLKVEILEFEELL